MANGGVGANSNQVPAINDMFSSASGCEKHIMKKFQEWRFLTYVKDSGGRNSNQINLMAGRLNSYEKSKNWHASWNSVATMFTALKVIIIWYCYSRIPYPNQLHQGDNSYLPKRKLGWRQSLPFWILRFQHFNMIFPITTVFGPFQAAMDQRQGTWLASNPFQLLGKFDKQIMAWCQPPQVA